ncbi:hypothetical protein B0T26DRAFT_748743 [Lasiosphaeria miniovina]|uniref:DNA replication factor Cdt1 C-terminal domain-containing protein n=1 Tax=Lasiosphaeria miniovina TaxID=1954250 RepID=A0AA40B6G0_9PEZI|nr:uncharacterized protein B0T26DRAFT_748743 [Lasiosphaeria miniovina]KAK0728546.1 hypothetical protein B0T26DRAFT_748743 [Lasiosphaeria miniovina]
MPGAIARPARPARGKLAASKLPAAGIAKFTRVSKAQNVGKEPGDKGASLETRRTSSIEIVLSTRKRKVDNDFELVPSITNKAPKRPRQEAESTPVVSATLLPRKRKTVTFAEPEAVTSSPVHHTPTRTPSSSRKRHFQPDEPAQLTPPDSDSSEAEALFERLNLQASPSRKRTKTCVAQSDGPDGNLSLPRELLDLVDLQAAFLKTLSMQYAHNSSNSPIDLRTLCPSATQAWGKRKVTADDIRICVGVMTWPPAVGKRTTTTTTQQLPFFLSDYGRGKICVEFHADAERGPLREAALNAMFEAGLRALWQQSRGRGQATQLFLATLPKAAVKTCASVAKAAPMLARGQRTLEELKNGVVRKLQEKQDKLQARQQATTTTTAAIPALLNPDGTKMTLLDRIRRKEQAAAQSGQTAPTAAQLQREAALHRVDEVAGVVGMLCTATGGHGQARISFTLAAVLIKLNDSLRNAISQEDGAACVRLLASEIAPQWLRIVTVGGRENVVVQTGFQPSRAQVQERVRALLG